MESKAVAVQESGTMDVSPRAMIMEAVAKGADLEKLEKLLDLQIKWEANEAKKEYVKAMAEFKKNPPNIEKDKVNKQFGSSYSSIESLVNTAVPLLSECGFSHNWTYPKREGENVYVTCVLTHKDGHSESVTMDAPPDKSGGSSKNAIQQIKSTHTYLKIATFEAVTGLVSSEINNNDDGNGYNRVECITDKQKGQIVDMINSKGVDETAFLTHMRADEISKIPANLFDSAMRVLEKAKGKQNDN